MTGKLYLKLNQEPVGIIEYNSMEDTFNIELDRAVEISPYLKNGTTSGSIKRFLMNLLPEGQGLEELSSMMHISKSNVFGLIKAIGAETTGAISFYSKQNEKEETIFREIPEAELIERISIRTEKPITEWDNKPRLSVAGIQEKLPIMITNDDLYGFGEGELASTHILKFGKEPNMHLVINEYFCIQLAKKLKLPVSETEILRLGEPVLSVKRFDRFFHNDTVKKLHVIDGCQMLDFPPMYKYERVYGDGRDVKDFREGVSLKKIFDTALLCAVPAVAIRNVLNWILFNLLIGNCDSHGKNISWYYSTDKILVAPFYDLLSIQIYGDSFNQNLAMAIGDNFELGVYAFDLAEMCETCNLQARFVSKTLKEMATHMQKALDELVSELKLNNDEMDFVIKLSEQLKENIRWYLDVAEELPKIG